MMPQVQLGIRDIQMDLKPAAVTGQQQLQQPRADLRIEQPAATLDINTRQSELRIDMSGLWKELGLLTPMQSVAQYAQDGKQENLSGIARRAREGQQMKNMAGKGQGAKIAQTIAKQNHGPKRVPFNIAFKPSGNAIDISFTKGDIDINITPQKPRINATINKPIHNYTPSKVSYTMLQRPSVSVIDVTK